MPVTLYHTAPPEASVGSQVLELVDENITELSMLAVPPSNLLFEVYRWALRVEIALYLQRVGREPSAPMEVLVSLSDDVPGEVTGFLLYAPVATHPEACGVNYMAVKRSHRRRGVGSELIKTLIARYPHAELTCSIKNVPFYESVGFQVLGSRSTQIVMNTRPASTEGLMAVLNVEQIFESPDAKAIRSNLERRWGAKEMSKAEKQLIRHVEQLEQRAKDFVVSRQQSHQPVGCV